MIAIQISDETEPLFLPRFYSYTRLANVDINALCHDLGVTPISEFLDQHKFDVDEGEDASTWYAASEGVSTFKAIADFLADAPQDHDDDDRQSIISELQKARQLLATADQNGKLFHLIVVIMMPGTEGLIG